MDGGMSCDWVGGSVLVRRASEFGLWRDIEKRRKILGSLFGGMLGATPRPPGFIALGRQQVCCLRGALNASGPATISIMNQSVLEQIPDTGWVAHLCNLRDLWLKQGIRIWTTDFTDFTDSTDHRRFLVSCLCDPLRLSPCTERSFVRDQFGCRFVVEGSLDDIPGVVERSPPQSMTVHNHALLPFWRQPVSLMFRAAQRNLERPPRLRGQRTRVELSLPNVLGSDALSWTLESMNLVFRGNQIASSFHMPSLTSAFAPGFWRGCAHGVLPWSVAQRWQRGIALVHVKPSFELFEPMYKHQKHSRATGRHWSHASCGVQTGLISVPSLIREECQITANQERPIL